MSLTVPHLGQAGLCGQVLVVDLPQQPSLVLLVHFFGDDEQQAPSAALPAPPLNLRSLPVRKSAVYPHVCVRNGSAYFTAEPIQNTMCAIQRHAHTRK